METIKVKFRKSSVPGKPGTSATLIPFFRQLIETLRQNRKPGTARNYQNTLNSFSAFLGGNDIRFTMITEELIASYEKWLSDRGVLRNSSSFYMRTLRSVYNKAVQKRLVKQTNPFANVYTGVDRTKKRAVSEGVIFKLLKLDLEYSSALSLSRDIFIFSYCTRGMAFVDVAYLKKKDISDGTITYIRRKTGQRLSIRIEPCITAIIKKYEEATQDSIYVFPVITSEKSDEAYDQYSLGLNYHNRKLKRLSKIIGENLSISSYTARHTWATAARNKNVPISVISAGMGHSSEKTTQIYLASLENSVIDQANNGIIGELNKAVSM